jgi:integrase
MASLQQKGDSWHCQFLYKKQRRTWVLGKIDETEAHAIKGKVEYLLMRLRQKLLDLPHGMDIVDYLACDGKPPDTYRLPIPRETTFAQLRDSYIATYSKGSIEPNTLDTCKLHLSHFKDTFGDTFPIDSLSFADLQRHVDRRAASKGPNGKPVSPTTIRKEVTTLLGAWSFGCRMGLVKGEFPSKGLRYPKLDEPPPFMDWQEVEQAVAAGGDPDELWDYLYLRAPEIAELLAYVKENARQPFVYPMLCFAAHTGARRSEIIRAQITDLDFNGQTVLIREKKRAQGKRTTRRVPLTPFLTKVLREWLKIHPGGPHLFCLPKFVPRSRTRSPTTGHKDQKTRPSGLKARMKKVRQREPLPIVALTRDQSHDHLKRTLAGSKWEVIKGWHVFRHSFISACANAKVDQRFLDSWVGHQTEQQRKRYFHLYRSTEQEAIRSVFGGNAPAPGNAQGHG